MPSDNPYSAPSATQVGLQDGSVRLESIASGQKLVIYAILVYFAVIILQLVVGPIAGVLLLVSMVMGIIGVIRLASGLGKSTASKVIFVVLLFIPLVGLITLLVLNGKATAALRAGGYRVGLLGASRPASG